MSWSRCPVELLTSSLWPTREKCLLGGEETTVGQMTLLSSCAACLNAVMYDSVTVSLYVRQVASAWAPRTPTTVPSRCVFLQSLRPRGWCAASIAPWLSARRGAFWHAEATGLLFCLIAQNNDLLILHPVDFCSCCDVLRIYRNSFTVYNLWDCILQKLTMSSFCMSTSIQYLFVSGKEWEWGR